MTVELTRVEYHLLNHLNVTNAQILDRHKVHIKIELKYCRDVLEVLENLRSRLDSYKSIQTVNHKRLLI